jgi:predicted RND superfamily exporter protein
MSQSAAITRANNILRRIEPLIYGRRWLTAGILLVLTALLAVEAAHIQPDAGFDKSIPLGHPYMQVYKQYESDFGGANLVLVALENKNGDIYNEKFLTRLKQVTDAVFFLPGVDRSHVSSLFTPDVRFIEVVEGGFYGANVIPSDYKPTPEMFEKIRANVGKADIIGRLVSKDQHGAMVMAQLLEVDPVTGKRLDYGDVARRLETEIRDKYQDQDISIHIIGFAKVIGDVIAATENVVLFFGLTLVMTMLLLWWYVGSFRLALLPMVCSITAVIWEFGLLKLFGYGLDPFAILVPFLILAVSVSHGVQYVNAWVGEISENGRNSFDASLYTWRRLAIYGTMAIMTDVAGFAMIALIPIEIIQEMALNACLGMAAIIITNKVMMPIWLTVVDVGNMKAFRAKQDRRDALFDGIWRHAVSNMVRPLPAVIAIAVGIALLGWSLQKGKDLQIGDSQSGVPELLPDSRYNKDNAVIVSNFSLGSDLIKVISETDPDACTRYGVMTQIDDLEWQLRNTEGVQFTLSLPFFAKKLYSLFTEGSPKFKVLPRDKDAMVQAITPVTPPTGMLNPNCSAMPIWAFLADHRAVTINRVVQTVENFNRENAAEYFRLHTDVDTKYCDDKNRTRRQIGIERVRLDQRSAQLHKKGLSDDKVSADPGVVVLQKKLDDSRNKLAGMDKMCPVNFALASWPVGVMAASNQVVERLEKRILLYVYLAIIVCVYLSFFEWRSIVAIMLPLALVSWMAYGVMAVLGIGMKVATLPVVALAVGIGVDYGIYVYATLADALECGFPIREAYFRTLKMTGKAVVFTGITLGLGVATWLFSDLQFQRDMGKLLVFMFTANMFGAILLLPAIATFLLKPRVLAPGEIPVFKSRH